MVISQRFYVFCDFLGGRGFACGWAVERGLGEMLAFGGALDAQKFARETQGC